MSGPLRINAHLWAVETACNVCGEWITSLGCGECMECLGCGESIKSLVCGGCMQWLGCGESITSLGCGECMECLGCGECMQCLGCGGVHAPSQPPSIHPSRPSIPSPVHPSISGGAPALPRGAGVTWKARALAVLRSSEVCVFFGAGPPRAPRRRVQCLNEKNRPAGAGVGVGGEVTACALHRGPASSAS